MRLASLRISNYRCFPNLEWAPGGSSAFLVGGPGSGKTTLLTAIALAVGRERSIARKDFVDVSSPIEVDVVLETTTTDEASALAPLLDFAGVPTLRLTLRAVLDGPTDEIEITRTRTDTGTAIALRTLVTAVPLLWVPAWRDPARMLAFTGTTSFVRRAVTRADIEAELSKAQADLHAAISELASATPLSDLADALSADLAGLIPDPTADIISVESEVQSPEDLLRLLDLAVAYGGPPIRADRSSTGVGQLVILALLFRLASADSLILVDEPEIALPPQAQRAFVQRLISTSAQTIISTHSSHILRRGDPRRVVRLNREPGSVTLRQTGPVTDDEAAVLARFSGTDTASAFFSATTILVEGLSDQLAIETLAPRVGVDLDAKAVSIVSCEGAGAIGSFLALLGPRGLGLKLLGLCDADAEEKWRRELNDGGLAAGDRAAMAAIGFEVADPDLEAELVSALGVASVEGVIDAADRTPELTRYAGQPAAATIARDRVLIRFVKKDKIFWAPRLAAALDVDARLPRSLFDLLRRA